MPQASTRVTAKGITLSFGQINLIVNVHTAVGSDEDRSLKTVCTHEHNPTPIKQRKFCPVCDNDDYASFAKAKEMGEGYVLIPQDILDLEKAAQLDFKTEIAITMHPAADAVNMMPSGKSYYLSMERITDGQRQAYTMLSQLIRQREDLVFMCKYTLRTALSIFQLTTATDGTLILRQMADAQLVRERPAIDWIDLPAGAMDVANMVADTAAVPFVEAEHGTGKISIVADYAATQTPLPAAGDVVSASGEVLDITAQLNAMLAASQPAPAAKVPAARKTTARKTVAKKTATKTQTSATKDEPTPARSKLVRRKVS